MPARLRFSFALLFVGLALSATDSLAQGFDISGELTAADPQFDDAGEFYDVYEIELEAGQVLDLRMVSDEVNAYLILVPPRGDQIDHDDVPYAGTDAALLWTARTAGTYEIYATTAEVGETGAYQLTAAVMDSTRLDRQVGTLEQGDQVSIKGGEYVDLIDIELKKGERRLVAITTAGFDAFLSVHTPDGIVLFGDDPASVMMDGGEAGGAFKVVITSYEAGEVGDYVVEFRAIAENL